MLDLSLALLILLHRSQETILILFRAIQIYSIYLKIRLTGIAKMRANFKFSSNPLHRLTNTNSGFSSIIR
jgi:hypothetical protein